ncbi:hypothetical protein BS329_38315 [Amycolatopsis coloradensis]|uniref:Uncharacterized protein n=1 Tax=Amycolatopsis coloradensis TaxID=76021 RepID=A0A1R0KEY6_9PSEU|nr:hypothetical protein [Amycolatopsis coloradensis]OLZ43706.1 hypothetical protein BS329_38315 [Amycolatopsis coloradensis]
MTSPRRVSPADQERLLALGGRTAAVLREAGFRVIAEPDLSGLSDEGGAAIDVDLFGRAGGVYVNWLMNVTWQEEVYRHLTAGEIEHPRVRQLNAAHAAVRAALTAVLSAAGLTVVPSEDDMRPLELRVVG